MGTDLTNTHHTWTCKGAGTGQDQSCSLPEPVLGACGGVKYTCGTSFSNMVKVDSTTNYAWTCSGEYGAQPTQCSIGFEVNGVCDKTKPMGCTSGVSVSGQTTASTDSWKCQGQNNGTDDTCSMTIGVCDPSGTKNQSCSSGVAGPNLDLPTDLNYQWICQGSVPSLNSQTCSAVKPIFGKCDNTTKYACITGTVTQQNASPTSDGTNYTWSCQGNANGSTDNTCSIDIKTVTPVCSSIAGGTVASANNGVVASLAYLPSSNWPINGAYVSMAQMLPPAANIVSLPYTINLSNFNVPDSDFQLGFSLGNGNVIKDGNGNILTQYFSLQADGFIGMSQSATSSFKPGWYQFALGSDDGAQLFITDQSGIKQYLDNTGSVQHSFRVDCGKFAVQFIDSVHTLKYHLDYFQAPGAWLGLQLFWRPASGPSDIDTVTCGTVPAAEPNTPHPNRADAAAIMAQSGRGWVPVPSDNLYLANGVTNSCATTPPGP